MNWSQQKSAFRFLAAGLLIILMAAVAQSNTLASIDPPPEKPFVPELGGFTEYEGSLVLDQNASGQVLADPDTEFDGLIEPETTPLGWVTTMSEQFEYYSQNLVGQFMMVTVTQMGNTTGPKIPHLTILDITASGQQEEVLMVVPVVITPIT